MSRVIDPSRPRKWNSPILGRPRFFLPIQVIADDHNSNAGLTDLNCFGFMNSFAFSSLHHPASSMKAHQQDRDSARQALCLSLRRLTTLGVGQSPAQAHALFFSSNPRVLSPPYCRVRYTVHRHRSLPSSAGWE